MSDHSEPEVRRALGLQLRRYRESLEMTAKEFAEVIGRDPSAVGKIERGALAISASSLMELHLQLGLSIDWLVEQAFPEPDFLDDRFEGRGPEVSYFTRMPRNPGRPFECTVWPREAGETVPRPAMHAGSEFIQLIKGDVLVTLGSRQVHLWRSGSVLRIPAWVEHTVETMGAKPSSLRWTMSEEGEAIHTAEPRPPSEWMRRVIARRRNRAAPDVS